MKSLTASKFLQQHGRCSSQSIRRFELLIAILLAIPTTWFFQQQQPSSAAISIVEAAPFQVLHTSTKPQTVAVQTALTDILNDYIARQALSQLLTEQQQQQGKKRSFATTEKRRSAARYGAGGRGWKPEIRRRDLTDFYTRIGKRSGSDNDGRKAVSAESPQRMLLLQKRRNFLADWFGLKGAEDGGRQVLSSVHYFPGRRNRRSGFIGKRRPDPAQVQFLLEYNALGGAGLVNGRNGFRPGYVPDNNKDRIAGENGLVWD